MIGDRNQTIMRLVTHMVTMYILINKITDDSKQNKTLVTHLSTSYIPINKITAHVNWFSLRCMHIYWEFPFMSLPKRRKVFFQVSTHWISMVQKQRQLTNRITTTNYDNSFSHMHISRIYEPSIFYILCSTFIQNY